MEVNLASVFNIHLHTFGMYVKIKFKKKGEQMITSLYPVLMSEDVHQAAQFFIEHFQFQETLRSDWYISLRISSGFELAFIDSKHGQCHKPTSLRRVA